MADALRALLPPLVEWARAAGPAGPAVFAAAYAAAALLLLPVWPLTLAVGLVYGPWAGLLVASPSGTLGATLAFLAGRRLLRGAVARRLAARPRLRAVDEAVEREGLRIVLLARLSPFLPYSLLNYALAATRLPVRDFVVASLAGSLPLTLLHLQLGALLRSAAELAGGPPALPGPAGRALLWGGLAATAAAVALLARAARRALDRSLAAGPPPG